VTDPDGHVLRFASDGKEGMAMGLGWMRRGSCGRWGRGRWSEAVDVGIMSRIALSTSSLFLLLCPNAMFLSSIARPCRVFCNNL